MEVYTLRYPGFGYVYGLVNPSFPGYVKIGKTKRPAGRLSQYNVSSPLRDYTYAFVIPVDDQDLAETQAHHILEGFRVEGGEWFRLGWEDALGLLQPLTQGRDTCQRT